MKSHMCRKQAYVKWQSGEKAKRKVSESKKDNNNDVYIFMCWKIHLLRKLFYSHLIDIFKNC